MSLTLRVVTSYFEYHADENVESGERLSGLRGGGGGGVGGGGGGRGAGGKRGREGWRERKPGGEWERRRGAEGSECTVVNMFTG